MLKDVTSFEVHLVLPSGSLHHVIGVWIWQSLPLWSHHDVDCETRVPDRTEESVQLEVWNVLRAWRHNVCRVEIVPDVEDFADGDPMVTLMCNETLLLRHVCVLYRGCANRRGANVVHLFKSCRQNFNRIVAAVVEVIWLPIVVCSRSTQQGLLFLMQLHSDLTERYLVEDGPLE